MLKETPQEQGCLYGCLSGIVLGGSLGAVAAYFLAGKSLPLLFRWAWAAIGFLAGIALWFLIQSIYIRLFVKNNEEEKL